MELDKKQQTILWVGATRYYIGRMTYAVAEFCLLLIDKWEELDSDVKIFIRREVEEAFERDNLVRHTDILVKPLGHDCDRAFWERVRGLWLGNRS